MNPGNRPLQVEDDDALLDLMLSDVQSAPEIFQPTNYWSVYHERIVPELREKGLNDFRRRRVTTLHKFGATDSFPEVRLDFRSQRYLNNRYTRKIKPWERFLELLNATQLVLAHRQVRQMVERYVAEAKVDSIDFEASLVGNPQDIVRINGKKYTQRILDHYLKYLYCRQYIDFETTKVFVELGPGSGKQVEVIRKLHPEACFFLFDIPPQLYVCEQYLKSVFPGSVVSYRSTRDLTQPPAVEPGTIYILGNWQFPLIDQLKVDLFWNSASFQEMEPHVVAEYLKHVNRSADAAYLFQQMEGKPIAAQPGESGVISPVTLDDYRSGLSDLELIDITDGWTIEEYGLKHGIWKRSRES